MVGFQITRYCEYHREMPCIAHEKLIKEWLQTVQRPPNVESAISAYLRVEEHRSSCELCRNERLKDQVSCDQSVKVTFVLRFPVAR